MKKIKVKHIKWPKMPAKPKNWKPRRVYGIPDNKKGMGKKT